MEVYVAVYDYNPEGWKVEKYDTEDMRVLGGRVPWKSDFIWKNMVVHINEMFLSEKDAWEFIKEMRMDKRYYLDTDGELKKLA